MKVALLLALAALSPSSESGRALIVGGIELGQSEASVIHALGKPTSRSVRESSDYLPITLTYPGFTIDLDEQGVGRMFSSSRRYCTAAGACPGMRLAEVQRLYGPALKMEQVDGKPRAIIWDDGCWLAFAVKSEVVENTEVACVP